MEFSYFELKQVAGLKANPGFVILLDAIKATLDDLSDELRLAKPADELQILAKWRVYQEVYAKLHDTVETFALEVLNFEEQPERAFEMPVRTFPTKTELSPEELDNLKVLYETKKNEVN